MKLPKKRRSVLSHMSSKELAAYKKRHPEGGDVWADIEAEEYLRDWRKADAKEERKKRRAGQSDSPGRSSAGIVFMLVGAGVIAFLYARSRA